MIQRALLHFYFKKHKVYDGDWAAIRSFEEKYADMMQIFGLYIYSVGYHKFRRHSLFRNKLVLGFYESPKYFEGIEKIIRDDFNVTENEICQKIIEDIKKHTAIAVGVRRGDFADPCNVGFCNVCSPAYYERGIKYILGKLPQKNKQDIKVYMFTDDVKWTRENIKCDLPIRYITSSVQGILKPWEMLHIISYCKYQVISNSSYFWWGQYLNDDADKIIVAPNRWRNWDAELFRDVYQDNWILMTTD